MRWSQVTVCSSHGELVHVGVLPGTTICSYLESMVVGNPVTSHGLAEAASVGPLEINSVILPHSCITPTARAPEKG